VVIRGGDCARHLGHRGTRLHPETKRGALGRRGKSSQNENSFVDDIAKKTGKGRSTIARKAARAKVVVLPEITGTSLDKGSEIDALAKLPEEKQRSLAEAARRGEKVSAISARSACGTEAPTTSNGTGKARSKPSRRKKADLAPTLDPRAWSMSTPQEREAFVKAVGGRDLEDAFNAIEPGYALTRCSLEEAWKAATPPERLAFAREYHDVIKTLGWQQKW
jgi:hypothetical protein